MYLEAKETARLYRLLTEKLGNDTTEAMFKYIDNKTERSVEATIKTLATKDDLVDIRKEISDVRKEMTEGFSDVRQEIAEGFSNLRHEMGERFADSRKETNDNFVNLYKYLGENTALIYKEISEKQQNSIKWMFVFWIGQFAATITILFMILKK